MIDKATLLAKCKRRYANLDVPGVGMIRVQSMTERERAAIEQAIIKGDTAGTMRARVLAACMVDEDGRKIWGDHELETISEMDSVTVLAIFNAIDEFTTSGDNVEELEKN